MISAIILAAGASSRMGSPKALLSAGEKSFLQHISDTLLSARITDRIVVLGSEADRLRPALSWFDGKIVVNKNWENGQLSSLLTGLEAVDGRECHGVLVWPVDRPCVSSAVCVDLLQAFWTSGKKIIVPVHQGKRGHPVIFSASLFPELRSAPPDIGARNVLLSHPDLVYHLNTDEEGVLLNIDTPDDYRSVSR